jgi:hypothetical protein
MPYRTKARKAAYMKTYKKRYNPEHCEANALYQTAYYKTNHERLAAKDKIEHADHREEDNERASGYYSSHRKARDAYEKEWDRTHPEQAKIAWDRHNATRRNLGFVPLNSWFVGCEGHHVDPEQVIFIPKVLHRSVYHCQSSGLGMEQMNAIAYNFLFKQEAPSLIPKEIP